MEKGNGGTWLQPTQSKATVTIQKDTLVELY